MLLAEDLLLLLTDDDNGKLTASSTEEDVALGGALLVELTLMQRVDVAAPDDRVREGRLVVRDRDPRKGLDRLVLTRSRRDPRDGLSRSTWSPAARSTASRASCA